MYLIIAIAIVVVLLGVLVKINFADSDVSLPVRIIVSGIILLIFAAGVYYLVTPDIKFLKSSAVVEDTLVTVPSPSDTIVTRKKDVIAQIQNPVKPLPKQVLDSPKKNVQQAATPSVIKADAPDIPVSNVGKEDKEIVPVVNTVNDTSQFDNYKVKLKAYFYSKPEESSRRNDFLFFFNSIPLSALDERNGFIQVSVKTNVGKRYEGWLSKNDLVYLDQ